MDNKTVILVLFVLLFLPIVSADIITPGYSPIEISNAITNIDEFPDYVFVSGASLGEVGMGPGMCPLHLVEKNGTISGFYYKFCSVSVFAIKKENWDAQKAKNFCW